jgi:integrase
MNSVQEKNPIKRNRKNRRQIRVNGKKVERTFSRKEDADKWYAQMLLKKERIEKGIDIGFEAKLFLPWAGEWISDRASTISKSTFRLYNGWLMKDFLPEFGQQYMHMIGTRDVERFLLRVQSEREFSNSTYNRMRTFLHTLFEDARKNRPQHLTDNPIVNVKSLTENPRPVKIFEKMEDINTYLVGAWEHISPPFWMAVMLFLNTGVRLGEALAIQRDDVDLSRSVIQISKSRDNKTGELIPYPKGKKTRLVPISGALHKALLFWFDLDSNAKPEDFVVRFSKAPERGKRWTNDGRPFSPSHTHYLHDKLCTKLGFDGITLHALRHSFATHQLNEDHDIYRLQRILGHQDISTTQRYLQLVEDRLKKPSGFSVGGSFVDEIRKPKLVNGGQMEDKGMQVEGNT